MEVLGRKPESQVGLCQRGVLFVLCPQGHIYDCRRLINTLTTREIFKSVRLSCDFFHFKGNLLTMKIINVAKFYTLDL